MITPASAQTSSTLLYDRNGVAAWLRSEPAQRVAAAPSSDATDHGQPEDRITLSPAGLDRSRRTVGVETGTDSQAENEPVDTAQATEQAKGTNSQALTEAEVEMVRELKQRDREVKTHEQAHMATAGQYARGGPSYTFQQGPDGKRYAVGGEVPIDVGKEKTPEETIQKMRTVRSAALAPASPSPADRSIAATASAAEAQARQEMQAAQAEERTKPRQEAAPEPAPSDASATKQDDAPIGRRQRAPLDVIA